MLISDIHIAMYPTPNTCFYLAANKRNVALKSWWQKKKNEKEKKCNNIQFSNTHSEVLLLFEGIE